MYAEKEDAASYQLFILICQDTEKTMHSAWEVPMWPVPVGDIFSFFISRHAEIDIWKVGSK